MAEKQTYHHIVLIPKLTSNDSNINPLAEKFREFRLGALTKSPDAFASTYEVESKRGLDQSVDRLITPKAAQYVALRRLQSTANEAEDEDVLKCLLQEEWVGMNVLLGPEEGDEFSVPSAQMDPFKRMTTASDAWSAKLEVEDGRELHYHVNGMFVDPCTRGTGLGKALMEAVLDRARAEGARFRKAVRVTLSVYSHNTAAYGLYTKVGFKVVERATSRSRPAAEAIHLQLDMPAP